MTKTNISIILFLWLAAFSPSLNAQDDFDPSEKKVFKNQLKFNVLAPFLEHLEFSLERKITATQSIQASFGMIGATTFKHEYVYINQGQEDEQRQPRVGNGLFFSLGLRHYLGNFHTPDSPPVIEGLYVEPSFMFGHYERYSLDRNSILTGDQKFLKEKINYRIGLVNFGYQGSIWSLITMDLFLGLGAGIDSMERRESCLILCTEFHRGVLKFRRGSSLAMDMGIKLGIAF